MKNIAKLFMIALLAFVIVSCATSQQPVTEPNIYTPPASQSGEFRKEAKSMMRSGNWRGARLNLLRALDAKEELGEDPGFLTDIKEAAEKSGTCEFCRGGDAQ